jgi:colanic acid/amylovoran biosynthesis glycosyltransferase
MKVDHIHAHFVSVNAVAAQVAADLIGITYSIHAHAFDIFQRNQKSVRRQLKLAPAVVTIAEYNRTYIHNLCPSWCLDDIRVVHCGLNPEDFKPSIISYEDSMMHILSVGSLVEKKGHEYLIDACAQLADKGFKFQCSIVGGGSLQEKLQAQINKYSLQGIITLHGAKNQAQILDLYRHSDIFVLACVTALNGDIDGIPVVLMEAMAMQIPVITTPVTGIPELVQDGKNGFLVPERDAGALALAIERLINDKSLRNKLGQQGRRTVLAGFDIHQTGAQMAEIFKEICDLHLKAPAREGQ